MVERQWRWALLVLVGTVLGALVTVSLISFYIPGLEPLARSLLNPLYSINRGGSVLFAATWPVVAALLTWRVDVRVAVATVFGITFGGLLALYLPMVLCCEGTFLLFRFDSLTDAEGMPLGMFIAAAIITVALAVPAALLTLAVMRMNTD